MPAVCINMWQNIWKMNAADLGGARSYIPDFEVYDAPKVKTRCAQCLIPMLVLQNQHKIGKKPVYKGIRRIFSSSAVYIDLHQP